MKIRAITSLTALCVLCSGLFTGCTKEEVPPNFLNQGEIPVKMAEPLDLGVVQMVFPARYSDPSQPSFDYKAQERILTLVENAIGKERNIKMELEPVYADDSTGTAALAVELSAAGDPPEIVSGVDTLGSGQVQQMPAPLALNDAIEKYGPNLAKVPALQMEPCRIGDRVLSLPLIFERIYVPTLNRKAMEQYGWQQPETLEDLTALLKLAKDAGIQPIMGLPEGMVSLMLPETARPGYVHRQEDGSLLPLWRSGLFRQAVDLVKGWVDAGYFPKRTTMSADHLDYLSQSNWLLSYVSSSAATIPGTDLIPLALPSAQGLVFGGVETLSARAFLYACDKPEALVTLLDWSLAKGENNSLMTFGEEGTDYKLVDKNTVQRLTERFDWVTQYFTSAWYYPLPMENCANPGLVAEINRTARNVQDLRALQEQGFVSLPQNTRRYAKPGSQLANAWETIPDASMVISMVRLMDGLEWQEMEQPDGAKHISIIRFQSLKEYDEEAAPYLKLLKAWLDGGYDPLADMVTPETN